MQPGLNKLLKSKILAGLLADIETLSGQQLSLQVRDLDDNLVSGSPFDTHLSQPTENLGHPIASRVITVSEQPIGTLIAQLPLDTGNLSSSQDWTGLLDAASHLLSYLFTQQAEKRALVKETLERYREINLLYNVQETIGARLDLHQIAQIVLKESLRVIKASTGLLLLVVPEQMTFQVLAQYGKMSFQETFPYSDSIAGWVLQNNQAVIVNNVASDPRRGVADVDAESLLSVPLTAGEKQIGIVSLYDKIASDFFTAGDQKLLTTLAAPAAIAIETAREVKAREKQLKATIRELRIEIDEIRKKKQVASVTTTDYFTRLQQDAHQLRREFEEEI